jgi:hypothetical protein
MTPLDQAHAAMEAAPDDDAARLKFYERLADGELFLALEAEAREDRIKPVVFEVEGNRFALVFDSEDRLTDFTERPSPFVAMSGRSIVGMLVGQNIGLAVNPAVAPSATLLPPEALSWLQDTLGAGPQEGQGTPTDVHPPKNVPESLIASLDAKLSTMAGMARVAYLAECVYKEGPRNHVIAFVDAREAAKPAMARAISEALTFSGLQAASLDILFLKASDAICASLARVALRFDLPQVETPTARTVSAPGMDPEMPPKLR